jgi:hypothetical protein
MGVKPSMAVGAGLALVLAAGAAAAWYYRDSTALRALHKCVQGTQVLYTDRPCPGGSQSQAVTGALTVVPGARAAVSAASVPNVRDLLAPKAEPSIRDKQMERAIDGIGR